MATQINPPFDGSKPCPGCQNDVRGISAIIHNFLTRCDIPTASVSETKAMVKIHDLIYATIPDTLTVPHPISEELIAVARELKALVSQMTQEGQMIKWTLEIYQGICALIPRAAAACDAYDSISTAHFSDSRHSHGDDNILRESKGWSWAGFVEPKRNGAYDYTVEIVPEGGDITHTVCGTHFLLHQHFKDILAKDPSFYQKVWCPVCTKTVPWAQFETKR